jgi:hypothetical protein
MYFCIGMGENNCSWNRRLTLKRETLLAAQAIYQSESNEIEFFHFEYCVYYRHVWQSRWINSSYLSYNLFYWLEARSQSSKYLFKFYLLAK